MSRDCPIANVAGWPIVSLVEVTSKIGSGATPRGGADMYLGNRQTFALVRSQNVFDRMFDMSGLAYISDEQAEAMRGVHLQPGDVLLNITGDGVTFGRACIVPEWVRPACVNQHVAIVRVDPRKADAGYVLSFLTHPEVKPYIESFNAGGSRRAITKGHIESFRLPLPPLHVQRSIARTLGALDDKIELNRQMNETLEQMAQALFKSWFVDFDPVRAKAEGRQPEGIDPATAALFPSRLVDSPLGPIPEGWTVDSLDSIARFRNGLALQRFPPEGDDYLPVIKIAEMRAGITERSDRASPNIDPSCIVDDGDVLFSWSGSLVVKIWTQGRGALNQHLFKVTSASFPRWFYLQWLLVHLPAFQRIAADKATTMGHIQRHHLTQARVVIPPAQILSLGTRVLEPLIEKQVANELQSRNLAAIRDELLPKLVSGELRVAQVE